MNYENCRHDQPFGACVDPACPRPSNISAVHRDMCARLAETLIDDLHKGVGVILDGNTPYVDRIALAVQSIEGLDRIARAGR